MPTLEGPLDRDPASPFVQHTISPNYSTLQSGNEPVIPFTSPTESIDDAVSIWIVFSHVGVYVTARGSLIPAGLGNIFATSFHVNLPDLHANLYIQVLHDILLWMMM